LYTASEQSALMLGHLHAALTCHSRSTCFFYHGRF